MKNKLLILVTVLFLGGMVFLTLFGRTIHDNRLPQVWVAHPEKRGFPYEYTDHDGKLQTGEVMRLALPTEVVEGGVYRVYSYERNGSARNYVEQVIPATGKEKEGYVEILSGVYGKDWIVYRSSEELETGREVTVKGCP